MLMIPGQTIIYIYTQPIDMRKQINGLVNLLADAFNQNPQQGGLFVFMNRERRKLKILFWDRNYLPLYRQEILNYDVAFADETTMNCWAHVRRKFTEALPNGEEKGVAGYVVGQIRKLQNSQ